MRKRFIRIEVMLNEEEHQKLMSDISKEGTTYSDHIRKLIMNVELKEKPGYEFYNIMKELTKIGTNLNQLARKANSLDIIDQDEYKKQAEQWHRFSNKVKRKFL